MPTRNRTEKSASGSERNLTRARVLEASRHCSCYREISRKTKVPYTTVRRILLKWEQHLTIEDLPRSGRPRLFSERDTRAVSLNVRRHPLLPASELLTNNLFLLSQGISASTLYRALRSAGLICRVRISKPLLRPQHLAARLHFARQYHEFSMSDWRRVIFSDESQFHPFDTSGRQTVWVPKKNPYPAVRFKPTVKHFGGSLMVWGAISFDGVGPIVRIADKLTGAKYADIMQEHLLPFYQHQRSLLGRVYFQQDNDPKHTSRVARRWFAANEVELLSWPSMSPDMNIIEHVWHHLDSKIRARWRDITNVDSLWAVLVEEWYAISPSTLFPFLCPGHFALMH